MDTVRGTKKFLDHPGYLRPVGAGVFGSQTR